MYLKLKILNIMFGGGGGGGGGRGNVPFSNLAKIWVKMIWARKQLAKITIFCTNIFLLLFFIRYSKTAFVIFVWNPKQLFTCSFHTESMQCL